MKKTWEKISLKAKIITAIIALGTGGVAVKQKINNDNKKIYLVDVDTNEKIRNALGIKDENPELVALVNKKKTKDGTMYKAIIYNNSEIVNVVEIDGKFLNDAIIDVEKIDIDKYIIKDFNNIGTVVNESGIFLRSVPSKDENNVIGNLYRDDNILITNDTINNENVEWMPTLSVTNKDIKSGYVAVDYVYKDNKSVPNNTYFVASEILNVRSKTNTNANILYTLTQGTMVHESDTNLIYNDGYAWTKIMFKDEFGNKNYGFIAKYALDDNNNITYSYLTKETKEHYHNSKEDALNPYIVDTTKDEGISLNLRKDASLNADVIEMLPNNSVIYTYSEYINNPKLCDGIEWIYVQTDKGVPGYIAKNYVKDLESEAFILVDGETGETICSKNVDEKLSPASITKVLTALAVLDNCKDITQQITFSKDAILGCSGDYQTIYPTEIYEGATMMVDEALHFLLLASDNTTSLALAENIFGSKEALISKMNEIAINAGCTNTRFSNTYGQKDCNHYTTCEDYAKILQLALKNDKLIEIMGKPFFDYNDIKLENHSKLLINTSDLYDNRVIATKTGYTSDGFTCVAVADINNKKYIGIVMGVPDKVSSFTNLSTLFNYASIKEQEYNLNDVKTKAKTN